MVAVNDYRSPLSDLVRQLKFHHRPELGPALARLLLLRLKQRDDLPPVDALVGVPLWHRRRWRRGYNQCDDCLLYTSEIIFRAFSITDRFCGTSIKK